LSTPHRNCSRGTGRATAGRGKFHVPDGVYDHFQNGIGKRGKELRDAWFARVREYRARYPELADQFYRMMHRQLPEGWDRDLPTFPADAKGLATRDCSGKLLNTLGKNVPWLMGGSADLAPSCKTRLTFEGAGDLPPGSPGGCNLYFGIREHAMAAVLNGMALFKVRAYGSGFLIFSDYARAVIRLSALMELPVIHIVTHDSIGVGEDGPTHQPVEHVASLRAIPGLIVLRPADANEVVEAWKVMSLRGWSSWRPSSRASPSGSRRRRSDTVDRRPRFARTAGKDVQRRRRPSGTTTESGRGPR
jgi:transketolase